MQSLFSSTSGERRPTPEGLEKEKREIQDLHKSKTRYLMHLHLIMGLQYTLTPSPPSPFLPSFPLLPLLSHLSLPLSQNAESHPVCRRHRLTLAELMPIAWQRLTKYMLLINNILGSYKKHWEDLDGGKLCVCVCVWGGGGATCMCGLQ